MQDKILVTYSTRAGSTKGVAEAIGLKLKSLGEKTDVLEMHEVMDLSTYKAVIAGSAIQSGKWLPEAIEFISSNKSELENKPFAAFLVCMTLAMPQGDNYRSAVASWMNPVRSIVSPVSEGLFGGTLDLKKIPSLSDRVKFKVSILLGVWKEGDHRDWDAIETWTENLHPLLNKASLI